MGLEIGTKGQHISNKPKYVNTISKAHPKASARAYAKCSTQQGYIGNSVIYIKRHSSSPLENPTQPHYLPLYLSHRLLSPKTPFSLCSYFDFPASRSEKSKWVFDNIKD